MCPFIRNVLLPDGMYHPGENRGYFKETDRTTGRDKKGQRHRISTTFTSGIRIVSMKMMTRQVVVTMYLTVSRGKFFRGNGSYLEGD